VNETSATLAPLDPTLVYPLALVPALAPIDADASGMPDLPADHPQWQRDVVSISSRARAVIATIVPVVVRTLAYWDHRIREIAFGTRSLAVDPAGCYRLR
jgi:hypothetical protein